MPATWSIRERLARLAWLLRRKGQDEAEPRARKRDSTSFPATSRQWSEREMDIMFSKRKKPLEENMAQGTYQSKELHISEFLPKCFMNDLNETV
jgi:hypothetical protein